MARERTTASLAALDEKGQAQVMARFAVLRTHLEEGVPPSRAQPGKPACRRERRNAGWRVTSATGSRVSRVPFAAMPARIGRRPSSSR